MSEKKHPYGYKVGYREIGNRLFVRQFITRTHRQAHRTLLYYCKYGHAGCRKKDIEKFNYSLKPITRKEYLAGIWDELPFALFGVFLPLGGRLSQKQPFLQVGETLRRIHIFIISMQTFPSPYSIGFLLLLCPTLAKKSLLLRFEETAERQKNKKEILICIKKIKTNS